MREFTVAGCSYWAVIKNTSRCGLERKLAMGVILESFFICLSMYTVVPVPQFAWNEKNMRYFLAFLPIVGIAIGGLEYLWWWLAMQWGISSVFYAAVATVLPVLVSGGIHADGFLDTCDGIFSHGNRETKLRILADPQAGAFGVIYTVVYFLLLFATFVQLFAGVYAPAPLFVVFALSRAVGAAQIFLFRSAKESGLKHQFEVWGNKKTMTILFAVWVCLLLGFLLVIRPLYGLGVVVVSSLLVGGLKGYFYRNFGGYTGDLVGFSVCLLELFMLLLLALGETWI